MMKYYTYSTRERLRQLWRIPVNLAFFSCTGVYAYWKGSSAGVAFSAAFFVWIILLGLWVMTLHPNIGISENSIFAFRFGLRLRETPWSLVKAVRKVYYRSDIGNGPGDLGSRGAFRRASAKWRIEIKGNSKDFFKLAFSNKICDIEELVSDLNSRIVLFEIPVQFLTENLQAVDSAAPFDGKLLNVDD